MLGIMVGTAALIIVLSAFNGLESLVKGFYQTFDPDLKATLAEGKYFDTSPSFVEKLRGMEGIEEVSAVLEDRVLLTFNDKEYIATLKGVDDNYTVVTGIKESIVAGEYDLKEGQEIPTTIMGAGVAYFLGYSRVDFESPVSAFVPREKSGLDFSTAFASDLIYPSGIFSIQPDFDEKYTLTSLSFAQDLIGRSEAVTAFEFRLAEGASLKRVKSAVEQKLGSAFKVQDRDEQQEVFFKVMKSENLFTFIVFALILAISTFTIMGSLTMLMLDKKENLFTLWAMGAPLEMLRQIFFKEGLLISLVGAFTGLFLGTLIIFLQENYGILSLGPGYVIDSYPVRLKGSDLALVSLTVFGLSSITSWLTSRRLSYELFGAAKAPAL